MQMIIKNYKNKTGNIQNTGPLFSIDIFYTLTNTYIDENLKYSSPILSFVISYLFRSSNFRHDVINNKNNKKKVDKKFVVVDILGWLSIILFVVFLFTGILKPLIRGLETNWLNSSFCWSYCYCFIDFICNYITNSRYLIIYEI